MLFKSYVLGRPAMVCSLCRDSCCVGWVLWQLSDQDVRWRWLVCAPSRILLESFAIASYPVSSVLFYPYRTRCRTRNDRGSSRWVSFLKLRECTKTTHSGCCRCVNTSQSLLFSHPLSLCVMRCHAGQKRCTEILKKKSLIWPLTRLGLIASLVIWFYT